MRISVGFWSFVCWGLCWGAAPVEAQSVPHGGQGYALLVGSNEGGPGQASLRYAEVDTERMAEVLTTLGGYERSHVERLLHPTAAQLRKAIERLRARVQPLRERGEQSKLFFYYSGHARADALNLGDQQVPLTELRERIESLPVTLSIVVLDACQSGAFSRPKGAQQAADFSFNSVERLNAQGIAVVASSNERELSQESELLRSSYFTHHWLVALRGAGDHNRDGRVTLSEAYQYAYNHTLANTAESAVGEQHATLETNLRGQDDVPLTQPALASARLRVPAGLEARVLVQMLPSWSVLAELDKVPGQPITLALPPGHYAATVRRGDRASRCSLALEHGTELELHEEQCEALAVDTQQTQSKGELRLQAVEEMRAQRMAAQLEEQLVADKQDEKWVVEVGLGFGLSEEHSRYLSTLRDFNFILRDGMPLRASVAVGVRLLEHLVVGLDYYNLEERTAMRGGSMSQNFSWTGHALNLFVQGDVSFGRRRSFIVFGRLGVGMSLAWTHFDALPLSTGFPDQAASLQTTGGGTQDAKQLFLRPAGFLGFGLQIMPGRFLGFQGEVRYVLADAIQNDFGDKHNLGGVNIIFGVRARTWE